MKTHYVRTASSQALTSDIRSFVFLTDPSESQGARITYLLCILFARSFWIFLLFPNAEVPFAIPHKGKNQGNFTGKYCTVLIFGRIGTRIPHPVSPSRSIQEILNIFRYFLIQVHFDKSEFSLKSPENRAFFILHRFNILLILHLTFPF